jgi:hypothetical protein
MVLTTTGIIEGKGVARLSFWFYTLAIAFCCELLLRLARRER